MYDLVPWGSNLGSCIGSAKSSLDHQGCPLNTIILVYKSLLLSLLCFSGTKPPAISLDRVILLSFPSSFSFQTWSEADLSRAKASSKGKDTFYPEKRRNLNDLPQITQLVLAAGTLKPWFPASWPTAEEGDEWGILRWWWPRFVEGRGRWSCSFAPCGQFNFRIQFTRTSLEAYFPHLSLQIRLKPQPCSNSWPPKTVR